MGAAPYESDALFTALAEGRARLAMLLEAQPTLSAPPGPTRQFGARLRERFYQGYTGDITRTYPVGGTFTPAQRDIYAIVLAAQEAGIAAAKAGKKFTDIQAACDEVLRSGLVRLGLVSDTSGQQFKIWATHNVSHWIGMEVHDVAVPRPLGPGMTFVIEPGIYIREAAFDNLPKTPENAAFIDKVRPAVQKYRNIGVRIEDSFLLTDTGLERLSTGVPRTIEEIERFLARE